ncbi:hypothetical protein ACFQY0_19730 [Haloferula chungangensis]|uniref:Transposase n=1 Tax=Haloferula chungangensis TaxID=1048331 RepID=A0ABW2LDM8_9BACT
MTSAYPRSKTPPATIDAIFSVFPTAAGQTELLLQIAPSYRQAVSRTCGSGKDALTFFEKTMDRLDLAAEFRQSVIKSLHEPPRRHPEFRLINGVRSLSRAPDRHPSSITPVFTLPRRDHREQFEYQSTFKQTASPLLLRAKIMPSE